MASSSSAEGSGSAAVPPKASLSLVPLVFSLSLASYLSLHTIVLLYPEAQIHLSLQELRSHLTIPVDDKPGLTFLGPMGDTDPIEMINFETGKIPFKHASLNLADWDSYFRSWTGYVKGWRDWYLRVYAKNKGSWEQYKISQCITLSLYVMSRNESLLIAASYFWSDALNAFLFGHGPMAPTLADVLVLISLDISSSDTLFTRQNDKPSHLLKTKGIGRW
jgi:hypothetical protein